MISKVYRGKNKPIASFAITLTGGFFIFIGGLFTLFLSAFASRLAAGYVSNFVRGAYASGILGVIAGVIVMLAATMYDNRNRKITTEWGTVAVIFSVLSLFSLGGFGVGFLLGLIGGLLGITTKD